MLKSLFPENLCLFTGLSRSGKSTLTKLFNLHYLNQTFSENELANIYNSLFAEIRIMIDENEHLFFLKEKYEILFANLVSSDYYEEDLVQNFKILKRVWEEKEIQNIYQTRYENELSVNEHLE